MIIKIIKYLLFFNNKSTNCSSYGTYKWDLSNGYPSIVYYDVRKCEKIFKFKNMKKNLKFLIYGKKVKTYVL